MNLRDFEYVAAVADERNFGRAAARCHVSQSTLSIQIKKMEDYLGVQLFERTNRSVMPTAAGEAIISRARHILRQAEEIRQVARELRDPLAGEVTLGAFPTLAPYLFPLRLGAVRKALPKIRLRLVEEKTAVLLDMLEAGKLDCALIAAPVAQQGIESVPLFHEPFYVAVPARHALADKKSITDAELAQLDLLLLDEGHCLRAQALEICRSIGKGEAGRFRATSLETLRQMVALGDAVTLMPALAVRPGEGKVKYIPLKNASFGREIMLCFRSASARRPLFEALGKCLKA
jgi:LysR family hydrogen peroxide-inducible transcriptional activator